MKHWQAYVVIFLGMIIALFTLKYANISWHNPMPVAPKKVKTDTYTPTTLPDLPAKSTSKTHSGATEKDEVFTQAPIQAPKYLPPINQAQNHQQHYQGDLSDTQAYQAYLDEKEKQLKQAYIAAVDIKVERIQALLARGVKEGLPEAQLKEARDKIAALKSMQNQLSSELSESK
ncbi:hypothetical protein [Pseudoalteromonas piscicida]|uniref:hypothetical protein n=1 Tax=Pseudoalteromonas piscicida TaxID=43662 RepID=UPI0030A55CEB